MPQDDDALQRSAERGDGIVHTPKAFESQNVACDSHDKQIVCRTVHDALNRHPCVRTTQHQGKGSVHLLEPLDNGYPQLNRIDRDDQGRLRMIARQAVLKMIDLIGKSRISFLQELERFFIAARAF